VLIESNKKENQDSKNNRLKNHKVLTESNKKENKDSEDKKVSLFV
jgi:hypothetical protein